MLILKSSIVNDVAILNYVMNFSFEQGRDINKLF